MKSLIARIPIAAWIASLALYGAALHAAMVGDAGSAFPEVPINIAAVDPAAPQAAVAPASAEPVAPAATPPPVAPVASTAAVAAVAASTAAPASTNPIPVQALAPPSLYAAGPSAEPVSLDLKDMDVVEVLKMLSKQRNVNLVVDKNVSGRVTLLLKNVEFWKAFRAILNSRDLAYAKEGDVVEIMSSQDYERTYGVPFDRKTEILSVPLQHAKARTARQMLEAFKTKVGVITVDEVTNTLIIEDTPENVVTMRAMVAKFDVPQELRIFRLNYATVEELEPKISPFVSKDYGNLQVDKRSNTIVVQDNLARINDIAEIIQAFDIRHKCVLIEAKIMQVIVNKSLQSGVNWQGVNWSAILSKLNGYHVVGTLAQNSLLVPAASVAPGQVTAPGVTSSVGILEKPDFSFIMNLLNTVGTTNLLSSPRVMALNNQEAKIHVGKKVAKITTTVLNVGSTTSNPVTTEAVEFLDVGVKLSVTPTISDDGTVTLKVKPEVSAEQSVITTADGSSIPVIATSEAEASLVVKDGVTVVLGGLIEDAKNKTDTGIPVLSRIPILGWFFRSHDSQSAKTELVIFLTPHIVTGDTFTPEVQTRLQLQPDGKPKKKGWFRRLFGF